jgi:hypothetical protein
VAVPASEPPKFKLRPKEAAVTGTSATIPATPPPVPVLFAPDPTVPVKAPPPFPVVAEPRPRGTNAPIPHIRAAEVPAPDEPAEAEAQPKPKGKKTAVLVLAACAVLAGGGFAYWKFVRVAASPASVAQQKNSSPAPAAPAAPATPPTVPSAPASSPSEVVSSVAHAPINAINKAQDAIAARRASEQNRVDAIAAGEEPASRTSPATPSATQAVTPSSTTAVRTLAPGLSATVAIEGSPEGSPAFRSFVANAKISGVVAGAAPKMFINGRLVRMGETVDPGLGVIFDRIDAEKRQVIFRDKSGATAARRF